MPKQNTHVLLRRASERGHADHGWLNTYHTFSFADYYDPQHMSFRSLRVINEDRIAAGTGFGTHPHRDMEIITYVRTGAITHQDSLGNKGRTAAGDIQVMSAGSGIRHAEYNLEGETTTLFQIWIMPRTRGGQPCWGTKPFPKGDRAGRLAVLASGYEEDTEALRIRADARLLGGTIKAWQSVTYDGAEGRHIYMVPATGRIAIDGQIFEARDGAAILGGSPITITAIEDAEIVLVDSL